MKWVKPDKIHLLGFWLSMPFISFALTYILYKDRVWEDWRVWAVAVPIIYLIGIFSWYGHELYDHFLRSKYPGLQQTSKRVGFKLAVNLLVMTPSVVLIFYTFQFFHLLGYRIQPGDLKYGVLVGLIVNLIFETLWELIYIIDQYKATVAEKEMLERLQLQQDFDALKQKVNPHFLFNCFNTLSSLISENKDQAEKFLDELSKVYRYLLRSNEDGMSTVENELNFIGSYFKLLQTRFDSGVYLKVEVEKQYFRYLLPSLSLQLLVENAVKHNTISKSRPLSIEIFSTAGNKLVVNNNLQRKQSHAASHNIGLQNIRDKYQLINQPGFQVIEDEKNYTVVLPLIWNNTADKPSNHS
jgi:two-component system LytT family sensor kinase